MLGKNVVKLTTYSPISAMILAGGMTLSSGGQAQALTADEVINNLPVEQKGAYIAGLVDSLAYARWLSDRPDDTGMRCVHGWFYGSGNQKWAQIEQWFSRHLDKPADALLHVLIKKECGD